MKILVIGGTVFLGRHVTQALLSRGHKITLFNRGQQNPDLFPLVERLRGDRDKDLSSLSFRSWDAVIDTCGYFPRQVAATTHELHQCAPIYVFISSVNQYADLSNPSATESQPSHDVEWQSEPLLTPETYGPLKAACEKIVRQVYHDGALILRPGCLVGPHDQAHRFSYWVRRTALGGSMLIPGRPEQRWQIVDVRDVADWLVSMIETGRTGTFNVVGPQKPITANQLIQELAIGTDSSPQPIWVETGFLHSVAGGKRWLDLAEWADLSQSKLHLYSIDNSSAVHNGLCFRPLAVTARDILSWPVEQNSYGPGALELNRERETLRVWSQHLAARSIQEITPII